MNFSRAASLTHDPTSALGASMVGLLVFMIRSYHKRSGTHRSGGEQRGTVSGVPRRVDHEQRRRQIADALVRIAATRGLHATGMREVAAEAGVSLRLVQYYFGTKEELMLAAMQYLAVQFSERALARIRLTQAASDGPASPRDVIAAILTEGLPADD